MSTLNDIIQPGDVLCYTGSGFMSWFIRVKTWSPISHVEVYDGADRSWASRDGQGVNLYPVRVDGLKYILRPTVPVDLPTARSWAANTKGQAYDWLGLFSFFTASKGNASDKQFCSEFVTRFLNRGGLFPFGPDYDCDRVSPGMFLASPLFTRIPLP